MQPKGLLFLLALVAGASFYATHWISVPQPAEWIWKGAGVGLLAVWAVVQARSREGWLIAAVLLLGAIGDVLLETHGTVVGALAFLAGHLVAVTLYLGRRARPIGFVLVAMILVAAIAFLLPGNRSMAQGIGLYGLGLGAMAGAAWASRFPRIVGLGALLFVVSDLLIFARMGPLGGSALPGLLVWPLYFAGQALIAWGVVITLAKERA